MNCCVHCGKLNIGNRISTNCIIINATTDTGDVNEQVFLDIELQNSGAVGGLQFDIYDTPNYLDLQNWISKHNFSSHMAVIGTK